MGTSIGARLGNYVIETLLAETRMSKVWLARDSESSQILALKTIGLFPGNEDIVEAARFGAILQESLCAQDQRVVRVHGHGESDGCFYIAMEFIDGKDISHILAELGRIPPDTSVRIALEVAEMLDNLHSFTATVNGRQLHSAVHGDIKPKNIRLAGDIGGAFAVKVLDFGTAKALTQSKPGGTRTPAWSPAYASPELLDRREMNPLSDRWALGVTLYEMVTGRVPFGAGKSIEEMEDQIRHHPAMPDLDVPGCPAALHAILFKLLNPDPDRRYQSARELCLELKSYPEMPKVAGYQGETVRSDSRPSPATATTRSSPVLATPAARPVPRARPEPPSASVFLRRASIALVAVLTVVWLCVRERQAWVAANALEADLAAERVSAPEARSRLAALKDMRLVWFPSGAIFRLMNAGFVTQGDAIVTRFRTTPLRAADWLQARTYFEEALQNDLSDSIRGRLLLCDGHLKRFQAQSEKTSGPIPEAAQKFGEAARLLPKSPDPWLGLAMLELYNHKDPEKGERALNAARERSFDFVAEGRWVSLLADCYRLRADALYYEALRIERSLPDVATQRLQQAIGFEQKAIDWFSKAPLYGKSLQNIDRCRTGIKRIQDHMNQPQPVKP
ncbi:MAG TPA: serine/threonine-protein kinase [Acidobacteriota bacterium]|nr:serine/threonine-protein kinase [Acidobacteriota bacterium]